VASNLSYYYLVSMHELALLTFRPPYILVRSDLPWAGGALDLFCIVSELCVACTLFARGSIVFMLFICVASC
jgi:hypothetical protein